MEMYGEIGVLAHIDNKLECHICGKTFHGLNRHINKKHGINAIEYRELFGLNRGQALVSAELHDKISLIQSERLSQYAGKFPQTAETLRKDWGPKLREQGRNTLRLRATQTILRPDVVVRAQAAANGPESRVKKSESAKKRWQLSKEKARNC